MDEPPSSPPSDLSSPESALAYYKAQYEQLEHELVEFQTSSQELEAELEKDVEAAEKRERVLQEKAETLGFEVEDWKTKFKQSKQEASSAQNILQKEITTLRDANRTFQLKLRDIEVVNDDFERQARNTSSSLEDLESKYNVAIERAVMMEEEIRIGEQERENLRIETQRLRDDLSDLKVEAEILQGKLMRQGSRTLPSISTDISAPNSPTFEGSPNSASSSPMINTPPDTKSVSTTDTVSETPTPPSPPISDRSTKVLKPFRTPMNPPSRIRQPSADLSTTPKPRYPSSSARPLRTSTSQRIPPNSIRATPSVIRNTVGKASATRGLPNSTSLTHIRSLTAQMQRLEQRVQSARSKLPAPVNTPPQASPRSNSGSALGNNYMPPSVTIRSRKRTGGSTISAASTTDDTPQSTKHVSRLSTHGISRLSFGPLPSRDNSESSRPSSRASGVGYARPEHNSESSRPSSRTSGIGFVKPERPLSRAEMTRPSSRSDLARPVSRTSMSGARTPLGHYSQSSLAESRRPRSSIGGTFGASHGHGHSQSVSQLDLDEYREHEFSTPSRRTTFGKSDVDGSGIPAPSGLPRRQSGGAGLTSGKRTSSGHLREVEKKKLDANMKPPSRPRKLSGVGESY